MTIELLVILVVIVIYVLIFGNPDIKRDILRSVGIHPSESWYKKAKQKEFAKYCKRAMKVAIIKYNAKGSCEGNFLGNLTHILNEALRGKYAECYNLHTNYYCIVFAEKIVLRRMKEIRENHFYDDGYNYSSKISLLSYVNNLWEKYHDPLPKDWMTKGFIS